MSIELKEYETELSTKFIELNSEHKEFEVHTIPKEDYETSCKQFYSNKDNYNLSLTLSEESLSAGNESFNRFSNWLNEE